MMPASSSSFQRWTLCGFSCAFFILLLTILAVPVSPAAVDRPASQMRIAVLPFANYSETENADQHIMPALRKNLEQLGFVLADEQAVMDFLVLERVRTTAYISAELARKLGEKVGADAVMLGSIFMYADSEYPKFGLSARLVSTSQGEVIWTQFASETGEDFTKILGLGTVTSISDLVGTVLGRLTAGMAAQDAFGRETETAYRVAVMPFLNKSKNPNAGTVVSNLFLTRLYHSPKFIPVEYGDVRQTVVTKNIRTKGELSYSNISHFTGAMHADAVLVGVVEHFDDGHAIGSQPSVIISARLIDTRTHRMLWYDVVQRSGDDKVIFFDIGKLRSVDKVAFFAVSDAVKRMEKLEWK